MICRHIYLFVEQTDILDTVVGGGVEFGEIKGVAQIDSTAGVTLPARLSVGSGRKAIDRLCEYTGTGGLAYTSRTCEEICLAKPVGGYSVLESGGEGFLAHNRTESGRTIFSG